MVQGFELSLGFRILRLGFGVEEFGFRTKG